MEFAAYQEQALRLRAEQSGTFRHLAYYYAVQRASEKLHALKGHVDPANVSDAIAFELLTLDAKAERCDALIERLDDTAGIWAYYTLTKILLAQGRIEKALEVGRNSLARDRQNTVCLNLVARYAVHEGHFDVAGPLLESILRINGRQQDVGALKAVCDGGQPWGRDVPGPDLGAAPKHAEVCFYLPVYNVEAYIRGAIEGLAGQSYPIREVLVIDDGTRDLSVEIAREYPVRIIAHDENRGLAAARNTAFNNAGAAWVGAIDTDAVPDPDYTQLIMMELENRDPRVVGAGGRLRERHTDTAPDRWRAAALSQDRGPQRICHSGLFGSNSVLQREAVLAVGGYDESCRTNGEDWYICRQLGESGRLLVYTPYAVAHHMRTDTLESVLRTAWAWFHWGRCQDGLYDRIEYVAAFWVRLLENEIQPMAEQCARNATDLLYIDLAHVFFTAYLDIEYCVAQGLITAVEAAYMQDAVLDAVSGLDRRFGGALQQRLRHDLEPLGQRQAEPGKPVSPECVAQCNVFVNGAGDAFRGFSREIYEAILSAGG